MAIALEEQIAAGEQEELTLVVRAVDHGGVEDHGEKGLGEVAVGEGCDGQGVVVDASAKEDVAEVALEAQGDAAGLEDVYDSTKDLGCSDVEEVLLGGEVLECPLKDEAALYVV